MRIKTYTMLCPAELYEFNAAYAKKYNPARQAFLELVQSGIKADVVVKIIQPEYGLNKRQVNSIRKEVEGAIDSAKAAKERHIKTLESQIQSCKKYIKNKEKQVKDYRKTKKSKTFKQSTIKDACSIYARSRGTTHLQDTLFGIHHKKRRLAQLEDKLAQIKESLLRVNLPESATSFFFVGSKGEKAGNQICQLSIDGNLKIRVPEELELKFGEYAIATRVKFPYGQEHIEAALLSQYVDKNGEVHPTLSNEALTYRFYCRDFVWYIAVTVDVPETPRQSLKPWQAGVIGVDLNPGVIGWAYVDRQGNLKAKGQFKINLHSKTSDQIEAILSDVAAQLVMLASTYGVPIIIENLDFSEKKTQLREKGRRYARMLSGFAYAKWTEVLENRCNNRGIQLIKKNPAYSSLIGLVKFMRLYGLSSDTAAAIVLARRALGYKEGIPDMSALPNRRHVWSHWNALQKKLRSFRRHDFFSNTTTEVNSLLEVNLAGEEQSRPTRKLKRTSKTGCNSQGES